MSCFAFGGVLPERSALVRRVLSDLGLSALVLHLAILSSLTFVLLIRLVLARRHDGVRLAKGHDSGRALLGDSRWGFTWAKSHRGDCLAQWDGTDCCGESRVGRSAASSLALARLSFTLEGIGPVATGEITETSVTCDGELFYLLSDG